MVWVHLVAVAPQKRRSWLNSCWLALPVKRPTGRLVLLRDGQDSEHGGDHAMEISCNEKSYELACSVSELPQHGLWLERLSNIYAREQRSDRSAEIMALAITCERQSKSPRHPHLADRLMTYAKVLKSDHQLQASHAAYLQAQAIYKQSLPEDDIRLHTPPPQPEWRGPAQALAAVGHYTLLTITRIPPAARPLAAVGTTHH